jgi:hypothetical protein
MPSNMHNLSSPLHAISIHLGGHSKILLDNASDPKYALANTMPDNRAGHGFCPAHQIHRHLHPSRNARNSHSDSITLMVTVARSFRARNPRSSLWSTAWAAWHATYLPSGPHSPSSGSTSAHSATATPSSGPHRRYTGDACEPGRNGDLGVS